MKSSSGPPPPPASGTPPAHAALLPGTRTRASPYSPFPFGSPLTRSRGSVLNPPTHHRGSETPSPAPSPAAIPTPPVRLRGREMFGGPVVFGGSNSIGNVSAFLAASTQSASPHGPLPSNASLRRANRLLSAAPYHSGQRAARRARPAPAAPAPEAPANSTLSSEDGTAPPTLNLSATAQTILATLDQLSTPLRDALKMPVPRAEKRRAMAEELMEGTGHTPYWRRRPHLGGSDSRGGVSSLPSSANSSLNGPPLRKIFTPLTSAHSSNPSTPRRVSQAKAQAQSVELVPRTTAPPRTCSTTSASFSVTGTNVGATSSGSMPSVSKSGFSLTQSLETPKSSFGGKIRAKVGEKAKCRADKALQNSEESESVPEFLQSGSVPKLEMAKMPAFSFSLPQSVPSSHSVTSNGVVDAIVTPPTRASTSSLDRNQAILTSQQVTSVKDSPVKASAPLVLKSSQPIQTPPISDPKVSPPLRDVKFVFTQPKVVPTSSSSSAFSHQGSKTFNFKKPIVVSEAGRLASELPAQHLTKFGQSPISQLPDLTQASSSSVLGHTHSITSGLMGFSYSPSKFAPKLKAGNVTDVRGDNNRLPDVASGITPAQSLVQGSVMDILGRQSSF
ncbi:nascent polypeptide-associated complex subunit alpha, muscle-specific form-like [Tigriopus californicus]|nr:nascent polypeptide-associated complex subunit alpha, muscle-specific form-like [Tigriopus californicus]